MDRFVIRTPRPTHFLLPTLVIIGTAIIVCAIPSISNVHANPSPADDSRFIGAWRLTFDTPLGPSKSLLTILPGGTLFFSGQAVKPASAGAPVTCISAAHGAWTETGANTGAMTWIGMVSDGEGSLLAEVTDSVQAAISQDGNSWDGSYQASVADPEGRVIYEGEGIVHATRIEVQIPAAPRASPTPS